MGATASSPPPARVSVGVDIGTTFMACAAAVDGRPEVVGLGDRGPTAPATLLVQPGEAPLVGEAAERRAFATPERFVREFKRRFGDPVPILLAGTPYPAETLYSYALRWVLQRAAERTGVADPAVVVAHPAVWSRYKLDLLAEAVRQAGAREFSFVQEPVAIARHYATSTRSRGRFLVYDLGGGTFDASVVDVSESHGAVVGTPVGIERLGGVDFDDAVFGLVASHVPEVLDDRAADDRAHQTMLARLRHDCVDAKHALSHDATASVPVFLPGGMREVRLTRHEFEAAIAPLLEATVEAAGRALAAAGIGPSGLTAVLLAGGSSRIPLVAQLLVSGLGTPIVADVDPKLSVALGAANIGVSGRLATVAPVTEAVPVSAPRDTGGAPPAHPPPRRSPTRLLGAAAAVAVILAIAVVAVLRPWSDGGGGESTSDDATTTQADTDEESTTSATTNSGTEPVDAQFVAQLIRGGPFSGALPQGLRVVEITDHNTNDPSANARVDGIQFVLEAPPELGITTYAAIEVYASDEATAARAQAMLERARGDVGASAVVGEADSFCADYADYWLCVSYRGLAYAEVTLTPASSANRALATGTVSALIDYADRATGLAGGGN